jgi:hypothetical protein
VSTDIWLLKVFEFPQNYETSNWIENLFILYLPRTDAAIAVKSPTTEAVKTPTESSDTTASAHTHVHFPDQLLQQPQHLHNPPQPSDCSTSHPSSIRTRIHDLPLATLNVGDGPGPGPAEDDYEEVEDTDYSDCRVGERTENIILDKPIPYRGNTSSFYNWYPVMNMDKGLLEYPGCHPDLDERNVRNV